MSGVFTSFGKLLFGKVGQLGKKNVDCGFENFALQGFNLNCKKRGFEKENQIYKVYNIYNK